MAHGTASTTCSALSSLLLLATLGCRQTSNQPPALIQLRLARLVAAPGFVAMKSPGDTTFFVAVSVLVSDKDIEAAHTSRTQDGLAVTVRLTPGATARLDSATAQHLGERIAVVIDGRLNGAPVVVQPLTMTDQRLVQLGLHLPRAEVDRVESAVAARWKSDD